MWSILLVIISFAGTQGVGINTTSIGRYDNVETCTSIKSQLVQYFSNRAHADQVDRVYAICYQNQGK